MGGQRRGSRGGPATLLLGGPPKLVAPSPPPSPCKKEPDKVRPASCIETTGEVGEDMEGWKETMRKMRDQIKQVQELPKVEVPKLLAAKMTSASSPDLSMFSSSSSARAGRAEASWEIRARYRNMRTDELYKSQLVKKSGYSWRDKVPEIQNQKIKFTEVRSNVVTDVAFIGATYVQVRRRRTGQDKLKRCCPRDRVGDGD